MNEYNINPILEIVKSNAENYKIKASPLEVEISGRNNGIGFGAGSLVGKVAFVLGEKKVIVSASDPNQHNMMWNIADDLGNKMEGYEVSFYAPPKSVGSDEELF
jgi:hypothetical protein